MSDVHQMSANVLLNSSRVLAGYAASELLGLRPELQEDLELRAFGRWHNLLVQSVEELAAAVAANRPELFVDHARWLRLLLSARDIRPDTVQSLLECLGRVLAAELPSESAAVAGEVCQQALRSLEGAIERQASSLPADSADGRLAVSYLLALLEGDSARAVQMILDAARTGRSVPDLYRNVLLPTQQEAGRMWQDGEINVAEEHFATAITRRIMGQLRGYAPTKPPNGKTFLASSVTGNRHDIGICVVGEFFEMDGWRVIQLGCDVPIGDLVQAVGFYQADLLGLSVSLRSQLPGLKKTIEAVRRGERGTEVKILVGGRALIGATDLAAEFGADGYAADPAEAVRQGSALVGLGDVR